MIRRFGRVVIGAGAACGVLCLLPWILGALGVGGAAVVADVAYQVDELLFCSPIGVRVGLGALALALAGYAVRALRRATQKRSLANARAEASCRCP